MNHFTQIIEAGAPINEASKALIMVHGRNATAQDILSLRHEFSLHAFYVAAPQAANFTWYPYSFLAPIQQNEPSLSSGLRAMNELVNNINKAGIADNRIYILGFSQGACLALEYATRNARGWGGVIAFTGGLIGDKIYAENYKGDFRGTKVYIGNSDNDPHVPLSRSEESRRVMEELGAKVTLQVYAGMPHTIIKDEVDEVNKMFFTL